MAVEVCRDAVQEQDGAGHSGNQNASFICALRCKLLLGGWLVLLQKAMLTLLLPQPAALGRLLAGVDVSAQVADGAAPATRTSR